MGGGKEQTNEQTNKQKSPVFYKTSSLSGRRGHCPKGFNRSSKDNMWSAIPVALLCVIVNWSERKQGSSPKGVSCRTQGDFHSSIHLYIHPPPRPSQACNLPSQA